MSEDNHSVGKINLLGERILPPGRRIYNPKHLINPKYFNLDDPAT